MSGNHLYLSLGVFAACLLTTFGAAWAGRIHTKRLKSSALSDQKLNKWLVGLSAGATANSGFVVTGAVGLGYLFGAQWLMLPLAWLLGDILFWALFPHRINRVGASTKASTMTDVITFGLTPRSRRLLQVLISLIILGCLGGYVAAQWIAGQKFLNGAFGLEGYAALLLFAALIVGYTAIGEFRGSVYADSLQALIRIVGTVIALAAVIWTASSQQDLVFQNWTAAGPDFLNPFPQATLWGAAGFVLGFAAAGLGFSLGQPQMVTRYLAGASPEETRSAWWIYLGFVHFTWLSMTLFGMILRGVMPGLEDPETGLSTFFRSATGPLLTGVIAADIFATIAATSNSLLVAMSQTARFDLLNGSAGAHGKPVLLWPYSLGLGLITMAISAFLDSSVFALALTSAALLGAALAPVMAARAMGWSPPGTVILLSIAMGLGAAIAWMNFGLSSNVNEALPGMIVGFLPLALAQLAGASRRGQLET